VMGYLQLIQADVDKGLGFDETDPENALAEQQGMQELMSNVMSKMNEALLAILNGV